MIDLKFNSMFVEAIKEGIKTSTIRTHFDGRLGERARALETCQGRFGGKEFGTLLITRIERIRFDEIDKRIARTEGYLHEDLLKDVLYEFYDLDDSSLLYYIVFDFTSIKEEP